MYLYKELKQEIFKKYGNGKSEGDTGSPESQIALFTYRIKQVLRKLVFGEQFLANFSKKLKHRFLL